MLVPTYRLKESESGELDLAVIVLEDVLPFIQESFIGPCIYRDKC